MKMAGRVVVAKIVKQNKRKKKEVTVKGKELLWFQFTNVISVGKNGEQ